MKTGITLFRKTGYDGPEVKTSRLSRNEVAASTLTRGSASSVRSVSGATGRARWVVLLTHVLSDKALYHIFEELRHCRGGLWLNQCRPEFHGMTGAVTVCDCCAKVPSPGGSPVACRKVELAARRLAPPLRPSSRVATELGICKCATGIHFTTRPQKRKIKDSYSQSLMTGRRGGRYVVGLLLLGACVRAPLLMNIRCDKGSLGNLSKARVGRELRSWGDRPPNPSDAYITGAAPNLPR